MTYSDPSTFSMVGPDRGFSWPGETIAALSSKPVCRLYWNFGTLRCTSGSSSRIDVGTRGCSMMPGCSGTAYSSVVPGASSDLRRVASSFGAIFCAAALTAGPVSARWLFERPEPWLMTSPLASSA